MKYKLKIFIVCCAFMTAGQVFAGSISASNKAGINGVPFQRLQTQINDLNAQIQENKTATVNLIAELTARVNNLQTQMDATKNNSNEELLAEMDRLKREIEILQTNLRAIEDSLATGCDEGFALRAVLSDGSTVCETVAGETDGAGNLKRVVVMQSTTVNVYSIKQASAVCPPGYEVSGGGFETPIGYGMNNTSVTKNRPNGFGWTVEIQNFSTTAVTFSAYAVCLASQ